METITKTMKKFDKIIFFIFAILSAWLTIFLIGPNNVWFSQTNWLYGVGDLTNSQLSWQYFQHDKWYFPLGKNPNYGLEVANSIIFTDNIPLFALFFKLFGSIIYEKFQYFGFWVFICFFLQLSFSYLLLSRIVKNKVFSFFLSFLFLLSPFMFFRLGHHFSLGAHWLILYSFYIAYFIDNKNKNFHWIILITLSLLIHMYFTVMIFIIYSFFLFEDILKNKSLKKLKNLFLLIVYSLTLMYVVGYFESSPINSVSTGYGIYKIDLFSFLDPKIGSTLSWSYFLPDLNITNLEGFIYIGLGNLLIIFLALLILMNNLIFKKINNNSFKIIRFANLYIPFFLMWSLTTNLSIMGKTIFNLNLPKYLYGLLSIFGATGRFAWPIIYITIFFSIIFIFKNIKNSYFKIIISLVLIIQLSDVSSGVINNSIAKNYKKILKKPDPIWKVIENNYDFIRTTYLFNNYGPMFMNLSKNIGKLNNIKTDIVLSAAMDRQKAADVRYELIEKIKNNNLDKKVAYIIHNKGHLKQLKKQFSKKEYGFFNRDSFWIMLANNKSIMNDHDKKELEKISFDKVFLNKDNDIVFDGKFLGFGWSHNNNKKGAWSEGKNSYLLLNSSSIEKNNLEINLSLAPYKANNRKDFEVRIFVNNVLNKTINLNSEKNITETRINFNNDKKNDDIKIHFEFSGLISPYDIFESPDARQLGVLLKSFNVKEKI